MHTYSLKPWQHEHIFGQDAAQPGERRSLIVVGITAVMMIVEVTAGLAFGSMALLADGLHMASHAAALGIAAFAYIYARRRARDPRFSFGTGKVNALAGLAGALLLAVFAVLMGWESAKRFLHPITIAFEQATLVAFVGLVVNGVSVLILGALGRRSSGIIQPIAAITDTTITTSAPLTSMCWLTRSLRCLPSSHSSPASTSA